MRAFSEFLYYVCLVGIVGVASVVACNILYPVSPMAPVVAPVAPVVAPVAPVVAPAPVSVAPITVNQKGEYKVDVKIDINIRYPEVRRFNPCALLF